MFDLAELQHKLQDARNGKQPSNARIRTAVVEKEASKLLMLGIGPSKVSDLTNLPISVVLDLVQKNTIEKEQEDEGELMRRKFLTTGNLELPKSGGGFTFFKR